MNKIEKTSAWPKNLENTLYLNILNPEQNKKILNLLKK